MTVKHSLIRPAAPTAIFLAHTRRLGLTVPTLAILTGISEKRLCAMIEGKDMTAQEILLVVRRWPELRQELFDAAYACLAWDEEDAAMVRRGRE